MSNEIRKIAENDTIRIYSKGNLAGETALLIQHLPTGQLLGIDAGAGFPEVTEKKSYNAPVERIASVKQWINFIAKLRGEYPKSHQERFWLLLTHGHLDHIWAAPRIAKIYPTEIFATPLTLYLLEREMNKIYYSRRANYQKNVLAEQGKFQRGIFDISYGPAIHSIPQSRFFVVNVPLANPTKNKTHYKILIMAEARITPSSATPGLQEKMKLVIELNRGTGYDLALFDALGNNESGLAQPEDVIAEPLEIIIKQMKGNLWIPYISSKIIVSKFIADIANKMGCCLEVQGSSLKNMVSLGQQASWIPRQRRYYIKKNRKVVNIVTGSQNEPGSFMNKISRGIIDCLRVNDSLWILQTPIPQYIDEIKAMYEAIAKMIPSGKIYMSKNIGKKLNLDVPQEQIVYIDDLVGHRWETTSGHGKKKDLKYLVELVKAIETIFYQVQEEKEEYDISDDKNVAKSDLVRMAEEFMKNLKKSKSTMS